MARGPEGNPFTVVAGKDLLQLPTQLTRRQVVTGAGLLVVLSACGSSDGGYDLTPRNNGVYDKEVDKNPDRGIQQVVFSYKPDRAGGSVAAIIQLAPHTPQEFRVVSKEDAPRPGYLVDAGFTNSGIDAGGTTYEKFPVIALNPQDRETVFIGVGSGAETYKDMRTYQIFPKVDGSQISGLSGRFTGLTTLQPPLRLRD